jgi:hypothetical protein
MKKVAPIDPMEKIIADALIKAGVVFVTDYGGHNPTNLDFYLPEHGIHIEVKQFYTPRIADQMSRANNVIAIQGRDAAMWFAKAIGATSWD